jgi:hypothetical protein
MVKCFGFIIVTDISISPITLKIMKEIPWGDGIGRIISQAFVDEPVAVSIIIGNFNKVTKACLIIIGYCDKESNHHHDLERTID